MSRPRILLAIPNTLSTRNLLRTDVLPLLKAEAERVILVAPFADEPGFRAEFVTDNVVAYPMAPYRPRVRERFLHSAIYNLYLGGSTSGSLQLFLDRWGDNHPYLGPLRRFVTRRALSHLAFLSPWLERAFVETGAAGGYAAMLTRERPDVAVFSRLFFCDEIPLMRAAARAGIPTVGIVASWDNLTNKGALVPRMDRLIVWNETMRREAERYHRYRSDEVAVTGAPHHDQVFAPREPLAPREAFFRELGLDPAKRLITYAGEDPIIAPDAPRYVELIDRFIREGRLATPCQLLVRPHPQDDARRFDRVRQLPSVVFDLPGRPSARYWMDMTQRDLRHLYETLRHSDLIVNVTSTIVVDAAFFDTPSICIGFAYTTPRGFYNSPLRFYDMDHYRCVMEAGATTLVRSEEELLVAINRYLADPGLESEGRRRIARQIAQFDDGRCGWRTAGAILEAARPRVPRLEVGAARNTAGRGSAT
ncbi:MAG: CDP-glycerol glycerophosphotransferase family protein [Candidatus Rokubacteria bacterium]|nr:CDP-glycerol glycerophosphotransferase family protein [Candidatus Rokubacteria bacterium]